MKLLTVWVAIAIIAFVGISVEAMPQVPAETAAVEEKPQSIKEEDSAVRKRHAGWGPAPVPVLGPALVPYGYAAPYPAWGWGGWGGAGAWGGAGGWGGWGGWGW